MAQPMHDFPEFHLGDRIRKAREASGYSAKALAELIGIDRNTLAGYESARTVPRDYMLRLIAEATGFTVDQLTGHEPEPDGGATVPKLSERRTPSDEEIAASRWTEHRAA